MKRKNISTLTKVRMIIDAIDYIEPEGEGALAKQEQLASRLARAWHEDGVPKHSACYVPRFDIPTSKSGAFTVDDVVGFVAECAGKAASAGYPNLSLCVTGGEYKEHPTLCVYTHNYDEEDPGTSTAPIKWKDGVDSLDAELCRRFADEGLFVQAKPKSLKERRLFPMSLITLDTESELCSKLAHVSDERYAPEMFESSSLNTTARALLARKSDVGDAIRF